jgi:serine/threonine protein kinase
MTVLEPGRRLGPYRIEGVLGRGGMAEVYRGVHTTLERDVAIKVLNPDLNADPTFPLRFLREAKTVARLNHPNIVTIYDFGEIGELAYLVMELATGGTLHDQARYYRTLSQVVAGLAPVGEGLQYAHDRDIVHRDIKPINILLNDEQRPLLADFGLARVVSESLDATEAGYILGTPQYMAPEQAGDDPVDHRADIYALGIITYQLIAGRVPYDGPSFYAIIDQHRSAPPPSIRAIAPSAPPALDAAIRRATAKRPQERFPRVMDFIGELQHAAADAPDLPVGVGSGAAGATGSPSAPAGRAAPPAGMTPSGTVRVAGGSTPAPQASAPLAAGSPPSPSSATPSVVPPPADGPPPTPGGDSFAGPRRAPPTPAGTSLPPPAITPTVIAPSGGRRPVEPVQPPGQSAGGAAPPGGGGPAAPEAGRGDGAGGTPPPAAWAPHVSGDATSGMMRLTRPRRRPTSFSQIQWLILGTAALIVVFINAVGLWLARSGRAAGEANIAAGITTYIFDNLQTFKSILTTFGLVLACFALYSMRSAIVDNKHLPPQTYRSYRRYHRFVGYLTYTIALAIGLLTCVGIFGFGTDSPRSVLHSVVGTSLLVVLTAKIAVVRYFPAQRRYLKLLGEGVFALWVLVFATSTLPYVWGRVTGSGNTTPARYQQDGYQQDGYAPYAPPTPAYPYGR